MMSKLAAGTTKVPWFDQAARNVAAMAWSAYLADRSLSALESLEFAVVAPAKQLAAVTSFEEWTDPSSIAEKVSRRIDLYSDDPEHARQLEGFHDSFFVPFLAQLRIALVSWEELIEGTDQSIKSGLKEFYGKCLKYN